MFAVGNRAAHCQLDVALRMGLRRNGSNPFGQAVQHLVAGPYVQPVENTVADDSFGGRRVFNRFNVGSNVNRTAFNRSADGHAAAAFGFAVSHAGRRPAVLISQSFGGDVMRLAGIGGNLQFVGCGNARSVFNVNFVIGISQTDGYRNINRHAAAAAVSGGCRLGRSGTVDFGSDGHVFAADVDAAVNKDA